MTNCAPPGSAPATDRIKACCTPASVVAPATVPFAHAAREDVSLRESVQIPAGRAYLGTRRPVLKMDGEGPLRRRELAAFAMDRTTVTTIRFARFVAATGYVTEAERIGWSFVFHHQLPEDFPATRGVQQVPWWRAVDGANWYRLTAQEDTRVATADHPVVHVSLADARAFAEWAGGRLPTEAEWEHAARGGLGDVPYPWGGRAPDDTSFLPCNIWQGQFPNINTAADGYAATAPADAFAPNGYGLHQMVGNVWEWTADPYVNDVLHRSGKVTMDMSGRHLLKGGSFLCHRSYCFRYRIAARTGNTTDSASTHTGFRLVYDD